MQSMLRMGMGIHTIMRMNIMSTSMITTMSMITTTRTITAMSTTITNTASLLRLLQLASPALPVGGFSYSECLESAVEAGFVQDEASATDWLSDQLHLSFARADLPVFCAALAAWRAQDAVRLIELNDFLLRTRESAELRAQAEQMGRSLAQWLANERDTDLLNPFPAHAPTVFAIRFAQACARSDASTSDAATAFAFGWVENMVQAALKAARLGQSAAQRILARLSAQIPEAVAAAQALPESDWQSLTPGLAILSAQHETQYSRLFRS
jgi:urease accessory protein